MAGGKDMVVVRLQPSGQTFEAEPGEYMMESAEQAGLRWPTICHGDATCLACYIKVETDGGCLDEMSAAERQALEPIYMRFRTTAKDGDFRLACRARVLGDVTVFKRGVRPRD
ncbi:2Fe-2S iron-sulfur cluster-binding protein [Parasphingorhabdus sp.]|uniref:2Fe-2S iron-sulfur cluster-binding protein n=1 Tax=Parasphingorhabdus sp. TaxID=2709688 RepID=UPI003A91CB3F